MNAPVIELIAAIEAAHRARDEAVANVLDATAWNAANEAEADARARTVAAIARCKGGTS